MEIDLSDYKKELRNFNHFKNGFLEGKIELEIPKPYKILWEGDLAPRSGAIDIEDINNFTFIEIILKLPSVQKVVKDTVSRIKVLHYLSYDGINLSDKEGNNFLYTYEGYINFLEKGGNIWEVTFPTAKSVYKSNNQNTFNSNFYEETPVLTSIIGWY